MSWIDKLRVLKAESSFSTREIANISGIPEPTLEKLFSGQTKNPGINTIQQLVHALGYTLDDLDSDKAVHSKTAPSISDGAIKLAKDYDMLDRWGKKQVRDVADNELARMEDEARFLAETTLETPEPKIINLFDNPSAAGPALGETGQGCQPYELTPDDPQGASYAVRVQGDSMEPDFPDGSIAFVNHDEMRDGDIGVFCVDGATVIKQYHYDAVLGMTYLFSLNRKRSDADLLITRTSSRSLVWQGRVITKRRYPVPGL